MQDPQAPDCLLTLSFPAALEEELIDLLRERTQWVAGFTVMEADGFGAGSRLHSGMEQVRGRAHKRLLQIAMLEVHAQPLLESLRTLLPSGEIAWWSIPLSGFGRFA